MVNIKPRDVCELCTCDGAAPEDLIETNFIGYIHLGPDEIRVRSLDLENNSVKIRVKITDAQGLFSRFAVHGAVVAALTLSNLNELSQSKMPFNTRSCDTGQWGEVIAITHVTFEMIKESNDDMGRSVLATLVDVAAKVVEIKRKISLPR